MRSALLAIVVVGFVALSPGSSGSARKCGGPSACNAVRGSARDCGGRRACSAVRLPAPITITIGRRSYSIARDWRVSRARAAQSPYPAGSSWFGGTDTWFMIRQRHLLVGQARTTLWRSGGAIAADRLGVIAAGPDAVAFQMDHRLYLAPYGGTERPVAHRELPLGWTAGGLYTYSYARRQLLLRSDTGAIVKVIAVRPREYEFDLASQSLYLIDGDALLGAHGVHTWRLGSLGSFGLAADTWLQPLGRLVQLEDDHRLVILRASGAEFASTALPRTGHDVSSPDSTLAISPHGSAIAFSAPFGQSDVVEVVYLLRAGSRAASPIHTERGLHRICMQWTDLAWHGSWLLDSDTQGRLAAVNTADADRTIELSGFIHRLLGSPDGFDARWAR